MWIRRLEVTHCAGIAAAGIDLAPGLNVLHGPNELGKSSLAAAIRAALLLQTSATAAEALRDWNSVEPASVSLTFEQEAGRVWRIRKTFGRGGQAYLDFSKDGREFAAEGRGREVDGTLQNILRWGIEAPGGRGGRRGMPSSLITTALLGEQSHVVAILQSNLNDDPNASGRDRLTEALQALAEDPRFKQVVDAVQARVDEAFTATGRKRTGRGSPWADLREQREHAVARERDMRAQVDESAGVRTQVNELNAQLLDARSDAERLATSLAQRRDRDAAERQFATAQAAFERAQSAVSQLADNTQAVAATSERLRALEVDQAALEEALAATTPQVDAARERVRELEAGADEQQRRLREQEAENRRLTLVQEQATHEGRVAEAEGLAALDEQVRTDTEEARTREAAIAEQRDLLNEARETTARERDELATLELTRDVARYVAALATAQGVADERDAARAMADEARALDARADGLRHEVESLNAPDAAEIERLRAAENEWLVAQAKLSVGFVAELTLAKTADADVAVDSASQTRTLEAGKPVEFEAAKELTVDVPNVATIRVRGGGRDLLAEAEAAEDRWQTASRAVFGRTGCTSVEQLGALRRQADGLLENAADLGRQAETARLRAEGMDGLEQRAVSENANVQRHREAIATFVNEGETLDELVASFAQPPDDEGALGEAIDNLQTAVRERERLCDLMDTRLEADERQLETQRAALAANEARLAAAADGAGDWRGLLAGADAERDRLEGELGAVSAALQVIRTEATVEVDAARQALDALAERRTSEQRAVEAKAGECATAREALARLDGQTGPLRANAEGQNLDAAKAAYDGARDALATMPALEDSADVDAIESDAARAAQLVRALESELGKAQGALEQMGGQYLDEQRELVEDEVKALDNRERELELDYGAWALLRETLGEAEQAGAAHLGSALVEPVSRRMGALTGGRYGDIAIGAQLDATGIELSGDERDFDTLSIGTQEQLALLLRLAIAEALETFVILDDQLTQTDPERMAWMRDLLTEAAGRVQIVVLTCHPADYQIDGTPHLVDLTQCLTRSDATSAPRPSEAPPEADPPVRRRRGAQPDDRGASDDLAAALKDSLRKG